MENNSKDFIVEQIRQRISEFKSEIKEQNFGNTDSPRCNATKTKNGSNQSNDEKYNGVMQHGIASSSVCNVQRRMLRTALSPVPSL